MIYNIHNLKIASIMVNGIGRILVSNIILILVNVIILKVC